MHSSLNVVKLPSIEEIEKFHGELAGGENNQDFDTEEMLRIAKRKHDKIISDAQEEAVRTIEQARIDAEKLKEAQSKLGYAEGKSKAEKETQQMLSEQKAEFERQVQALETYREQMFVAVRENVINCLDLLLRKIVFKEFDEHDEVVSGMINHFYSMIKERSELVLKVSNEDYARLDMADLEKKGIAIKVDETYGHGDLTITCDAQSIDFGLENQLFKMARVIGVEELND